MRDFTVAKYVELLEALKKQGYAFAPYRETLSLPQEPTIVLRHDVDLRPANSLRFARIQHQHGIRGTYYFRAVPQSWDEDIILEIASLGHEIGYHYECLTTTSGNMKSAIQDFEKNLEALRKLAPVDTICMHGSPMSKWDSKDLWEGHSYRDYSIIGEPYFDTDFEKVQYLTDTGRRWDGSRVSVRDKVTGDTNKQFYHATDEVIRAATQGELKDQIMFTFHPQRWDDDLSKWLTEYILQNLKNVVKRGLIIVRK